MWEAAGQHTDHQLVCKVAQMGVIWNSFFGRHHRSVAKVSVSRSDEPYNPVYYCSIKST